MPWHGAGGLSLTSHVSPAVGSASASKTLPTTFDRIGLDLHILLIQLISLQLVLHGL